jgi:hypothetical protein
LRSANISDHCALCGDGEDHVADLTPTGLVPNHQLLYGHVTQ